jgi:hypothetical protein
MQLADQYWEGFYRALIGGSLSGEWIGVDYFDHMKRISEHLGRASKFR